MRIAIEHLELDYSLWLIYEYINASILIQGGIIYTNIDNERVKKILARYGEVYSESIKDLYRDIDLIILDPKAREELEPDDIDRETVIVVGGILGDNPPKGRTYKLLTSRIPWARSRNLGDKQMSIDGAVYTAYLISKGYRIKDIKFIDNLNIIGKDFEVILPYRYPLKENKPILSYTINKIVKEIGIFESYWMKTL